MSRADGRRPDQLRPLTIEVDYLENITQIQRAWDKELETSRDELMASARSIEEIDVAPTARNIEITKYLILWATALP